MLPDRPYTSSYVSVRSYQAIGAELVNSLPCSPWTELNMARLAINIVATCVCLSNSVVLDWVTYMPSRTVTYYDCSQQVAFKFTVSYQECSMSRTKNVP